MLPARYVGTGLIRKQVNYEKMQFWNVLPADCYSGHQNAGVLVVNQLPAGSSLVVVVESMIMVYLIARVHLYGRRALLDLYSQSVSPSIGLDCLPTWGQSTAYLGIYE